MQRTHIALQWCRDGRSAWTALAACAVLIPACNVLGPQGIRGGRSVYNQAIASTNAEQILSVIVRAHRQEPSSMLKVASITANTRVQANLGAQFGVGPESNFTGNLVPLSAGALYEENPTIVYLPVEGADFLRQMLSPLPLDMAVLFLSALGENPLTWTYLIKGINGVQLLPNAVAPSMATEASQKMEKIGELLTLMQRQGEARWIQSGSGTGASSTLFLRANDEAGRARVDQLRALLGVRSTLDAQGLLSLPVKLGVDDADDTGLVLLTRSPFELVRLAGDGIGSADAHHDGGRESTESPVHDDPAARQPFMRIHSSPGRPESSFVAVEDQGQWYWIDERDKASKFTFWILAAIVNARITDNAAGQATPVLTVPTSR